MNYVLLSYNILLVGIISTIASVLFYLIFSTKTWVKEIILLSMFIMLFGLVTLLGNKGVELSLFNNNNNNGLMVYTNQSVYEELQRFTSGRPLPDIKLVNNSYIVFDCN